LDRWLERERHLNRTTDETLLTVWRSIKELGRTLP